MPYTDAPIFAQTSGYLQKWYFDIGAEVKAGAVLAEIDTPEVDAQLAQAQAKLKVAEATRDLSKVTYQRYQVLFQRNVIAAQERDTAADNYGQDFAISRDLGSKLEISQGLSESDQIITSPPPGLVDGTRAQRRESAGSSLPKSARCPATSTTHSPPGTRCSSRAPPTPSSASCGTGTGSSTGIPTTG
jgi:multidrug efflux pump subunit AcrA (membrane-fusion protein)